jgi:lysophospholipase L1-like esterase
MAEFTADCRDGGFEKVRKRMASRTWVESAARGVARVVVVGVLASGVWACSGSSPSAPTPPVLPPVEPIPQPPPQPPPTPPPPTPPPVPPKLTITKFMAFGDSLTEGVVSFAPTILMRLVSPQAYPGRLQAMLVERYTAQTPVVINQGLAGELAEEGVSRFVRAIRNDNPEAVLLLEGINDISASEQRGPNAALAAIDAMMKEARNRRVAVFLATLPPERQSTVKALSSSIFNRYNEDLRRLARGEGAVLVDLARDLDVSAVGVDGIHLTEAGYERVAELFLQAIIATKEIPAGSTAPAAITLTRK